MNFDIEWEVLKELTETYAISGFEEDIVNILKKHINFPCSQDGLGSCLFTNLYTQRKRVVSIVPYPFSVATQLVFQV